MTDGRRGRTEEDLCVAAARAFEHPDLGLLYYTNSPIRIDTLNMRYEESHSHQYTVYSAHLLCCCGVLKPI